MGKTAPDAGEIPVLAQIPVGGYSRPNDLMLYEDSPFLFG
jgi:hypothetical protein